MSIKMKNCKTFYVAQTASCLKSFSLPPAHALSDKILPRLWNKNFLTEIYGHLLSKFFKNVVLGRQEMVQCKCFFSHTGTFVKSNVFGCVAGAYYFHKVRKMIVVF